jgi:hypothetical protein
MDELVVSGGFGEGVDALLGDLPPTADPGFLADLTPEILEDFLHDVIPV